MRTVSGAVVVVVVVVLVVVVLVVLVVLLVVLLVLVLVLLVVLVVLVLLLLLQQLILLTLSRCTAGPSGYFGSQVTGAACTGCPAAACCLNSIKPLENTRAGSVQVH